MTHPTITKAQAVQLAREAGYQSPNAMGPCEDFECFDLHAFAQAAYKLGRNGGLEEAKDKIRIHTLGQPLVLAEKLTSAIESLKDPS
jgi:hypothetical protein